MSIVGILVDTHHEQFLSQHHDTSNWFVRHAWVIGLAGSLLFWAAIAAALHFAG